MRFSVLAILIVLIAASTFGCVCCPTKPVVTPTLPPANNVQPTVTPTVTVCPPTSHIYMPEQTTNGRTYPTTPVYNGSGSHKPGGLAAGELGRQ